MVDLNGDIKKSIQAYYNGQDIHHDPNAKYTLDALSNFENKVHGKGSTKKANTNIFKPKGSPSTAPIGGNFVIPNAPKGLAPAPLAPMKAPTKKDFLSSIQSLNADTSGGQ